MNDRVMTRSVPPGHGDSSADIASSIKPWEPFIHSVVSWPKWRLDLAAREDVKQAVRVELLKALSSNRDPARLKAMVRQICVHRCVDEVRRQIKQRQLTVSWEALEEVGVHPEIVNRPGRAFDPVRAILLEEARARLDETLRRLDPVCDQSIRAFYVEGKTYKDMAEEHSVPVSTVGTRLFYCLEKLRRLVRETAGLGEDLKELFD